jgi:hypothetical protein
MMHLRQRAVTGVLSVATLFAVAPASSGQPGSETFTATAAVKTAGGVSATAPVTIVVDRKMPQSEAGALLAAFQSGGAAALRKALAGVAPTGSIRVGGGAPTPSRLTVERVTDKGRLLTIVTDKPILFLGGGIPGAKAKQDYDFAVVDIEVDAAGSGSGTLAPAAKVAVKQGAFVVDDYASEVVRLTGVTLKK